MNWSLLVPLVLVVPPAAKTSPTPLVHTYSIVARDPATGQLGVAVQSHYFSVGPLVPWAESGVGAVATQSLVLVDYGPNGLELMRDGKTAQEALNQLLEQDSNPNVRQVAMVDAQGNVAVHTGPGCIPDAGHTAGHQYSVQANLMANDKVWPAMSKAFEAARGDLAERMLQALEAGEKAGGDIRGKQSAALLIVRAESTGKPWMDRLMDLRIEDHETPLVELRRLVKLRRAYNHVDEGDALIAENKPEQALEAYEYAAKLAPDVVELQFWAAVSMYTNDREKEALDLFEKVFARQTRWVELVPRLARVGLFPNDAAKIAEVQAMKPKRGGTW